MTAPSTPQAWHEPCAGSAAVGLALLGAAPPCAYMGSKAGYADAILRVLGLRRGQWAGSHPGRLRLSDPGPWGAWWAALAWGLGPEIARALRRRAAAEVPEVLRGDECWGPPCDAEAERLARWIELQAGSYQTAPVTLGGGQVRPGGAISTYQARARDGRPEVSCSTLARRVERLDLALAGGRRLTRDEQVRPGDVVLIDPPYRLAPSGYEHDLPRPAVVDLARECRARGALVAVCEGEPLSVELGPGWVDVEITDCRAGSGRRIGGAAGRAEWLAVSRAPAWVPEAQGDLGLGACGGPGGCRAL